MLVIREEEQKMTRDIDISADILPDIEKAYNEVLNSLSQKDFIEIVCATWDYILTSKEPKFNGIKKIIWMFMKPIADKEIEEKEKEDE